MLAIARALVRDPKIILLDEPFEGLAPVIVQDLVQRLPRAGARRGRRSCWSSRIWPRRWRWRSASTSSTTAISPMKARRARSRRSRKFSNAISASEAPRTRRYLSAAAARRRCSASIALERRAQSLGFADRSEVVLRRPCATRLRLAANLARLPRGDGLGALGRLAQPPRRGLELVVATGARSRAPGSRRPARARKRSGAALQVLPRCSSFRSPVCGSNPRRPF